MAVVLALKNILHKPAWITILIGFCILPAFAQVRLVWEDDQVSQLVLPTSLARDEISIEVRRKGSQMAILGETTMAQDSLVFRPTLRFEKGMEYEVYSSGHRLAGFVVPRSESPPAYVKSIFPTADTLPQNLLKLYIVFHSPMAENQAYQNILLADEQGHAIKEAFLPLTPELWDRDRQVFTLWFDPGRVKTHLLRNQKLGAPLRSGKNYTLVISNQWTDKEGNPLEETFRKSFFVKEKDIHSPDLNAWKIKAPEAHTSKKLVIDLGEPLDYSLILGEMLGISLKQQPVQGQFALSHEESVLEFTPSKPWEPGSYQINAYHALEDLAGNNLNRPFDRDVKKSAKPGTKEYHTRYFMIQ